MNTESLRPVVARSLVVLATCLVGTAAHAAGQAPLDDTACLRAPALVGFTSPEDVKARIRAIKASADRGETSAQFALAMIYNAGIGAPRNRAVASSWFRKAAAGFEAAAKQGDLCSQSQLAVMFELGEGVARDPARAARLHLQVAARYRSAAEGGDARSQFKLAQMYERGRGVPFDRVLAAIWYRKAADQGDASAQIALGLLYRMSYVEMIEGPPLQDDGVQAYLWLSLGVSALPKAQAAWPQRNLDVVVRSLNSADLETARRLVRDWRPVLEPPSGASATSTDSGAIRMTPAQTLEAERVAREWAPTPAQLEAEEQLAHSFDMALGSPDAKVTVVEYGSASGFNVARFHNEVFQAFKARNVDTGKVRFIFRELVTPPKEFAEEGVLLARCAGKDRYFDVLDRIYANGLPADELERPRTTLLRVAQSIGLSEAQFDRCLSDQPALDALRSRVRTFTLRDHIQAVPTFVVGSESLFGRQSLEELERAISKARAEGQTVAKQ
jgi:protein-disulfide isomerase